MDLKLSFQRRTENIDVPIIEQWSNRLWSGGKGKKKKRRKKGMCLMKMLHHVCLIPFCIIDMNYWYDSCKVFFKQLNNLLLSMLPQRVPDLDKKLPLPRFLLFFFFGTLSRGHRPFSLSAPIRGDLCCGPRWRNKNIVLEFKKEKKKKSIRTSALPGLMWMALASENVIIKEKFVVQL